MMVDRSQRIPVSGTKAALQRSDAQTYMYGGVGPPAWKFTKVTIAGVISK